MMFWLWQTGRVSRTLLAQARYRRMVIALALAYLVVFLIALQNITGTSGAFSLIVVDPAAMFRRTGFLLFDAFAVLQTPLFTWLVAPLNIAMGLVLSFLVGLNLTLSWVAWRQPRICSVHGSVGSVGLLPALLAGGACCAPTILLVLGIQASAALMTTVQWLIPLAFALLLGSLIWIAQKTQAEQL